MKLKRNLASRRALKVLGIFSGVQVFSMACSAVKAKAIALWLGAEGLGIMTIYSEALATIDQLAQLNTRTAGVRQLMAAPREAFNTVAQSIKHLGAALGLLGALLTVALSPLLSSLSFGNTGHTLPFILLSATIFINAIIQPRQAILQAGSKFRQLAASAMWGGGSATLLSILLYRFYGIDGIVPSLILTAVCTAVAVIAVTPRIPSPQQSHLQRLKESTPVARLGLYLTAATFTTTFASYIFITWLNHRSGQQEVGIYKAGWTIISQYVGVVFAAMSVEYFPRLSAVSHSPNRLGTYIGHEIYMLVKLLTPAIVLFIIVAPWVVRLLYSAEFLPIVPYLVIAACGTLLKAASFAMAYAIPARGDGTIYLVTESLSSALYVILSIVGYLLYGLKGVAVGYIAWYAMYTLSVYIVCRRRYNITTMTKPLAATAGCSVIIALTAWIAL